MGVRGRADDKEFWILALRMGDDMHEEKRYYGMHKKATVHRAMELGNLSGVYLIFTSEIPYFPCCTQPLLYKTFLKKAKGRNKDEAYHYNTKLTSWSCCLLLLRSARARRNMQLRLIRVI